MVLKKIVNAKIELVCSFNMDGLPKATGYVAKFYNTLGGGGYCWSVGGKDNTGASFNTKWYSCPFELPHEDFASWIANAYLGAISAAMGGGDYGVEVALRNCFGSEWKGQRT